MGKPGDVIAFAHVPKTAGMSLNSILVRYFGCRHLSVSYRGRDVVYRARDLRNDLRIQPFVRSIAGHSLKPFEDFGDIRLRWYTFLRNPVDRFISHFQHEVEKGGKTCGFAEWYSTFNRHNWQVRMIAGVEDLELAKDTLARKFAFVGLQESFDKSLLIMRRNLGIEDMEVSYERPVNQAKSNAIREEILRDFARYEADVTEQNKLDIELYRYVCEEIWPQQVEDYGAAEIESDLHRCFGKSFATTQKAKFAAKGLCYKINRALIYKPFVALDNSIKRQS